jgi:hypothetical protein
MSDNNLEQRINIKFCVKIRRSDGKTFALLTVAYGEYAMKKSSVSECNRRLKEWREIVQDDPRSGTDASKCGPSTNLGALRSKIRCETNSRRIEYDDDDDDDNNNNNNKTIPVTGRGGPWGCETSRLAHFLDNLFTKCGEVVSLTRRPPSTPRNISGTHVC